MNGDFTFQGNWWFTVDSLPPQERDEFISTIVEYGVTGRSEIPPTWPPWKQRTFCLIIDQIDRSLKDGTKGQTFKISKQG